MPSPAKPLDAPDSLPLPLLSGIKQKPKNLSEVLTSLTSSLEGLSRSSHPVLRAGDIDLNAESIGGQRVSSDGCYDTFTGPEADFSVPTLESRGMKPISEKELFAAIKRGEAEALRRLKDVVSDAAFVATFAKPKTR